MAEDLEEGAVVKKVIENLRSFLQNNLSIDEDFVLDLQAKRLLNETDVSHLRASLSKGGSEALYSLLDHVASHYDQEMLEKLCSFLEDYSERKIRPRLRGIAEKIRNEMKRHQPGQTLQPVPPPQNGVHGPTATGPPSSPPASQGEPTPTMSTMDERSQKIEEIVDMYRSESTKVSLPEIPELQDDFDNIIIALNTELSSADPKVICKLHGTIRVKYRSYIHGVKPVELPSIPNTAGGLYDFIAAKSTLYEILLIHHAVDVLETEDLQGTLQRYESNLGNHLRQTLESYKKRKVTLPLRKDHTHLAIVLSKEQILLSLVLHIKEYLMKYLQLEETIFEGFREGCTVLFYSILKVDAVLLAPKILSHSAELKRMFDITHLVVFDYFACDLERATIELPERHKREAVLKEKIATLKTTLEEKDLQLKQKDTEIWHKDEESGRQYAILLHEHQQLQQERDQLRRERDQLQQESSHSLSAKPERHKREAVLKGKIATLKTTLEEKDLQLKHKDEESGCQYAVLLHEHQQLQQEHDQLCHERDQLPRESSHSLSAKPVVKKPPRNWKDRKCRKILECGDLCWSVSAKGDHIAVSVPNSIEVYDRCSTDLLHTIEMNQLGQYLPSVAFYGPELILVSDYYNSNIKMFTIEGRHVRTIDRGSTTFSPYGMTISPDEHIYVCDGANHCVCILDVYGKFLFSFGSRGSGDECFNSPEDLCFASNGFLYITDVDNSRICVYDKDGKFIRKFTTTNMPWCIDATDCGHLIVSSFLDHKFMIYTTEGDLVHVFGEHGSELEKFYYPDGISVDSDGLIYIVDCYNHRIQVF